MSNLRRAFEDQYGPVGTVQRRAATQQAPAPTARRASPLDQPRAAIMGGLLAFAAADYLGVSTGIVNGTPGGNPVYCLAAAITTVALWLLLPGYTPRQRADSRIDRLTMYFALLALHGIAAAVAWTPVQNPTAAAILDSAGSVLVVVIMTAVSVRAWYLRTAGRA